MSMSVTVAVGGHHHRLPTNKSDVVAPDSATPAVATSTIDASGSRAAAASLSALLGRLDSIGNGSPSDAGGTAAAETVVPRVLSTLLAALDGTPKASTGAASPTPSAASSTDSVSAPIKPNLDALNRVLAHYASQSAAVDTIVTLVRS